mgnify:FL=1
MTKRRNLSSMQSTIADPESKLALENERINNLLERPDFVRVSFQGIVLYANNTVVDAKGTLATAVRVRVEGLTDRSIPDPATAGREACSSTNRFINQCLEAHPIAYPRKSQTGATNFDDLYYKPSQGDIVEVFIEPNGSYTYGGKIGTSPIHASMIYNFDASSQNKRGTTGAAQAAMNNGVKTTLSNFDNLEIELVDDSVVQRKYPVINLATSNKVPTVGKAFIDTLAAKESQGKYNLLYGGGTFDDYSKHPNIRVEITRGTNTGQYSTAAGKYQFIIGTWRTISSKYGLTDFEAESQDIAAWELAKSDFNKRSGKNLEDVLSTNIPEKIAEAFHFLRETWTSLPGSSTGEATATLNEAVSAYFYYLEKHSGG